MKIMEPSSSDLSCGEAAGCVVTPPLSHTTTNSPPQTQCSSPSSNSNAVNAPKFGTLVPNRIFVGGLAVSTTDADLSQLFSGHGAVKSAKVIVDRAFVSKGYGFVTFSNEDDARKLIQLTDHINYNGRPLNIAPAIKKQKYLRRIKKYLRRNNLPMQALPVLDNAPAYPPNLIYDVSEEFTFINVLYLPPNTILILQPLDQQPFTTSNSYESVSTPQPMPYAAPHPPIYYAGGGQYSYSQPYSSLYMAPQMPINEMNPPVYQGYGQPAMSHGMAPGMAPGMPSGMAHPPTSPAGYQLVYSQPPPMYITPQQQFSVPYPTFNMVNQQSSTWVDPGMTAQYQVSPCQPYLVPMY